jgi:Transposase IS66 family
MSVRELFESFPVFRAHLCHSVEQSPFGCPDYPLGMARTGGTGTPLVPVLACCSYLRFGASHTRFLQDGRIVLDTTPVEWAIRPVARGRKNHIFAGSDSGAKRRATICSLVETAKLNSVGTGAANARTTIATCNNRAITNTGIPPSAPRCNFVAWFRGGRSSSLGLHSSRTCGPRATSPVYPIPK